MTCRPLAPHEHRLAAWHMAGAFLEDPGISQLLPAPSRRAARLAWLMGTFLRLGTRHGTVVAAGDQPLGIAVFFHSREAAPGLLRLLRGGWAMAPLRLGLPALIRAASWMPALERERTRHMAADHVYLLSLSVAPEARGQGLGGTLLNAVLDHASHRGLPCYLETFNPANLPFYQRHGFALLGEARPPAPMPPFWCLVRR